MYSASAPGIGAQAGWPRLLGDIGGTNARLGWLAEPGAPITALRVWPCAEYAGPTELVRAYLTQVGLPTPDSAVLGMANPVTGDAVRMTNLHWRFSVEAVRSELGLQRLLILNDFTALALSLPSLPLEQLHPLGHACPPRSGPMGLIGAGTGLGVSGLLPVPGTTRWVPIMGEGGHVTLTAHDELEFAILQCLRRRYGHVSAERVLSGGGLVDLYHALVQVQGITGPEITSPAELLSQGLTQTDSVQRQTLDVFCGWLGSVAGDLALTLGAVGGVYVGGGIAPRMREHLEKSTFRQRFVAKGRYQEYLQTIPTWLINAPVSPALDGAALALDMFNTA